MFLTRKSYLYMLRIFGYYEGSEKNNKYKLDSHLQ